MELCEMDQKIVNIIQTDFPVSSRPYLQIARQVDTSEDEVFSRVRMLKEKGFIRRIGGIFDSKKMGFVSTLVALRVLPERLEEVGNAVSAIKGVTHNYQRQHFFNLWFTLTVASEAELQETLHHISIYPGVQELRNLPAVKLFKIGVNFKL